MLSLGRLCLAMLLIVFAAAPLFAQPTVTINQAGTQADPTATASVDFSAVFSQDVTGFDGTDITFTGSTAGGTLAASVTGGPTTYTVTVTGMTSTGTIQASILAGVCTATVGGAPNQASTSSDNVVTYDITQPTVTVNLALAQNDPTNNANINFAVTFSETVTGFDNTDVTTTGSTAGGTLVVAVTGSGTTYNVQVTGATSSGNVQINVATGGAQDLAGNNSTAPTNTDNIVAFDNVAPTVTIDQGGGQSDPTSTSPISFDVVFSESVTGFTGADVSFTGSTAGGTLAAGVSGSGTTYTVTVTGMTTSGTVIALVNLNAAQDAAGNNSAASTSTDNTVTWNQPNVAPVLAAPSAGVISIGGSDPNFTGTITVGGNLAVGFTATDANAADTLTFTITVTGGSLTGAQAGFVETFPFSPAGGTSPETANLTGTAANAGTITLTISVSDGTLTDQYTLAITINTGNSPPVLGTPTSGAITIGGSDPNFTGSIAVGGNLGVSFPSTDANAADTLTFTITVTGGSLTGAQAGFVETFPFSPAGGTSPETASLTGTAANTGTITLTISVSDGTVTDQYTLAITITSGNVAPVLASPTSGSITIGGVDPNFTGAVSTGSSLAVAFNATDANAADTLTFTITVTGGTLTAAQAGFSQTFPFSPAGGTSPETANLTGTAANAGTITLTISVSDGTVTDQYTLAITISLATPASITVLSPNGGETRVINSGALITWTNGGGFTGNVDILLSTDSGSSFPTTVASNIANNGFFNWTVPNSPTTTARIRVRATGSGTPSDDSNADFTIVAGTLGGAVGHAGGAANATTATPGGKEDALHFHIANDATSPAAFTVTSVTVTIATNDNASNLAISHLAGARLQNSSGSNLSTVLNSATGWSVAGTTITVTFGAATPLNISIPVGQQRDFYVELFFTNVTVSGTPNPAYACRIDNDTGTALNGGGTSNYPGEVAGGSVTLLQSIPGDEFDDDNGNCSTGTGGRGSWIVLATLASALLLARRLRRRVA